MIATHGSDEASRRPAATRRPTTGHRAALKLVREPRAHEPGGSFTFERRSAHRKRLAGSATALCTDGEGYERRNKICRLHLRDISRTGVGVRCDEPLTPGAVISIYLPPHHNLGGLDLYGRITRCDAAGDGYEIGVRLLSQQHVA